MIVTGSLRTVAVKLLYQLGIESPYLVTLLYLCGQSLSLVVHCAAGRRLGLVVTRRRRDGDDFDDDDCGDGDDEEDEEGHTHACTSRGNVGDDRCVEGGEITSGATELGACRGCNDIGNCNCQAETTDKFMDNPPPPNLPPQPQDALSTMEQHQQQTKPVTTTSVLQVAPNRIRSGSETGLTPESSAAVAYIHSIPDIIETCHSRPFQSNQFCHAMGVSDLRTGLDGRNAN